MYNETTYETYVDETHFLHGNKHLYFSLELAVKLGLNEAIVLQELHSVIQEKSLHLDGYDWVHKTFTEWHHYFPFWSLKTVQRIFRSLEKKRIIISKKRYLHPYDTTKYYRIDFENLQSYIDNIE